MATDAWDAVFHSTRKTVAKLLLENTEKDKNNHIDYQITTKPIVEIINATPKFLNFNANDVGLDDLLHATKMIPFFRLCRVKKL